MASGERSGRCRSSARPSWTARPGFLLPLRSNTSPGWRYALSSNEAPVLLVLNLIPHIGESLTPYGGGMGGGWGVGPVEASFFVSALTQEALFKDSCTSSYEPFDCCRAQQHWHFNADLNKSLKRIYSKTSSSLRRITPKYQRTLLAH